MNRCFNVIGVLMIIFFGVNTNYGQSYRLTYDFDVPDPINGGFSGTFWQMEVELNMSDGSKVMVFGETTSRQQGTTNVSSKPVSITIISYHISVSQGGGVFINCQSEDIVNFNNACELEENGEVGCSVTYDYFLEPILDFESGTTGTPASICATDQITLVATTGFGSSYKWQYRIQGGNWTNFNLGTGSSVSFDMSDVFGSNLQPNYNKNINFRYSVGNCSIGSVNAVSGTYSFYPDHPIATSHTVEDVECKGDTDWNIRVTGISRSPSSGETFEYSVLDSDNVDSSGAPLGDVVGQSSNGVIGVFGELADRTYYVLIEGSIGALSTGCGPLTSSNFYPVYVNEPNVVLSIGTPTKTDETCRSSNDGTITINASGGWGGYTYSLNSTSSYQASNSFDNLSAGNYTMRVRDSEGCVASTVVQINQPSSAFTVPTPSVVNETCRSANDGTITITPANGWGKPYYYRIRRNGGSWSGWSSSSANSFTYTRGAGTYSIRVKDKSTGGCEIEHTNLTISQPAGELSIGTPTKNEVTCRGGSDGSITINASSGWGSYTYSIDGASYQGSDTFSSLAAGNYTVSVKDAGGCIKSGSITILEPSNNLAQSHTKLETCFGTSEGSITVTASGGWGSYEYSKDNGASYQSGNIFSNLSADSYTIIVRDLEGCTTSPTTVDITQPSSALSLSFTKTDANCMGSPSGSIDVVASGGWGDYEYSSDGGVTYQSNSQFTNLFAGSYDVVIKDVESCQSSVSTVIIDEPTEGLTVSTSSEPISCQGSADGVIEISASGGWGTHQYSIDDGTTYHPSNMFADLSPGLYEVRVKDAGGCETAREDIIISEPTNALSLTIDSNDIVCKDDSNGSITLNATGGWGNYQYSIDGGTTYQSENEFTSLLPGGYAIVVQDAEECETSLVNITIEEPLEALSLSLNKTDVSCAGGNDGTIESVPVGGWQNYEYSIDGINYQTDDTFTNLSQGSYTLYVRDANGCTDQTDITITEPPTLTGSVTRETDATCGDLNGEAEVNVTGGTTPYNYIWTNTTGDVVGTEAILTGVGGGVYTATVTDDNGCEITRTANVSSEDGAVVSTSSTTATSCFDSADGQATISISGASPFDIVWSSGETGATANRLSAGDNVVTVTDANGCVVVEVISIDSPEAISYTIINTQQPTCHDSNDGRLAIQAQGGAGSYTYAWDTGTTDPSLADITQGTYQVTITDANGCSFTDAITLEGVDPISITITETTEPTCVGDADGSVTVDAAGGNGNYTYQWDNGTAGAQITDVPAGDYQLTVTDEKGCAISQIITLEEPEAFEIDLGGTVEICEGAAYEVSYPLPNATYTWTSGNGFSSTDETVILNVGGTYTLEVINEDGCMATDSFELIVSSDLLNADFLMVNEAYVGDTVIVIDISWPIPEDVAWAFDEGITVVEQNKDLAMLTFTETGRYEVFMDVSLADCQDFYSQSINVLPASERSNNTGRTSSPEKLITSFKVYPNPSDGQFDIEADLSKETGVNLKMIDLSGNTIVIDKTLTRTKELRMPFNQSLNKGLYLVMIEAEGEQKTKRLMIK